MMEYDADQWMVAIGFYETEFKQLSPWEGNRAGFNKCMTDADVGVQQACDMRLIYIDRIAYQVKKRLLQ